MVMETKSIYSHTYVVGRLAKRVCPSDLERGEQGKSWTRKVLKEHSDDWKDLTYESLCATYYSALIDSSLETEGHHSRERFPDFLKDVCCYELNIEGTGDVDLRLADAEPYPCRIDGVRLYFYPCDVVLFVIGIDDSGMELDAMTFMHGRWKEWQECYAGFCCEELETLLKPLSTLLGDATTADITADGTKTRLFQVVQTASEEVEDDLLFELGTFAPVGVVKHTESIPEKKRSLKPSDEYYHSVMDGNTVTAFYNWKALALNDSFTVLATGANFSEWERDKWNNIYFPLLYMRCLFEKTYCFGRNDNYRNDHDGRVEDVDGLLREISNMERYYFYNDISYNFLPPMIYRAMARGMDLQSDRDELTSHIKEALRDERRRREEDDSRKNNRIIIGLTALAALSALSVLGTMVQFLFGIFEAKGIYWAGLALLVMCLVAFGFILLKGNKGGK